MEKAISYYQSDRSDLLPLLPPQAKRVLDIGCGAAETWGKFTKESSLEVWGVEINPVAAEQAEKNLSRVIVSDVEKLDSQALPQGHFDVVFLADVLEHLLDPWAFLARLKPLLSGPSARIVSSIPNIRHYRVLKRIVFRGTFRYTDNGILDRTHLRFFCRKDIVELFSGAGFDIEVLKSRRTASFGARLLNLLSFGLLSDFLVEQYHLVARRMPS